MIKKIFRWWVGYKLPLVHVNFKSGIKKIIADIFYHPIKRRIAKYYIYLLQKLTNIKVIAITGSAGKTTTKEMLASFLMFNGNTVYSKDNIDPVFNIPTTILKCNFKTKYLVLEFGVEYPNEMDFYLWLVTPDIGVITNIYPTHTLFFKDEEGVLKEKSKLVMSTKTAILNKDNKYLKSLKDKIKAKIFWFTEGKNLLKTNENVARKVAEILNIDNKIIKKGLSTYTPQKHRLAIIKHKSGATIVDDSYNSNPEALIASVKYFNNLAKSKDKIIVIGDMLELGQREVSEHKRIANFLKKYNFNKIYGVGELVGYITPHLYSIEELAKILKKDLKPNTFVLIKGSRSIGLDRLVDKLV